ncbi:MAG: DmsE family decaheme c-type cytochrome [Bacteroidota bacterium]|nr:DmsE family decaheme c-type cytochrome [Bacteroidota bacterium]
MVISLIKKIIPFSMAMIVFGMLLGFTLPSFNNKLVGSEEAVERGKLVFNKYGCFVCHGNEGSGGVKNKNSSTGGVVTALTFTSRAFNETALRERIIQGPKVVVKADLKGPTPPLSMPNWRGVIMDSELTDLVVFLQSLTPEEGEEPKPVSKDRPPVPEFMLANNNCKICHSVVTENFKTNPHYGGHVTKNGDSEEIVCATCHGDGKNHASRYGDPDAILRFTKESSASVQEKNAACLQCHEKGIRLYWKGSTHESKDLACMDCHKIMEPASPQRLFTKGTELEVCFQCHQQRKAQMQRSSHMPFREGKVKCSDCHNPHGTANEKLLTEATVNENCYKCHADKRGPFLWEHPPVAENCLNCHDPHGSNHEKLLVVDRPRLCQRCHIESRHMTQPQLATARFAFNRSCQNCHSQIHGSNSPSGVRFHR